MNVLYVAVGGMLGAVARYALGGLVHRLYDGAFPLGTVVVNTLGCLVIGLLTTFADDRGLLSSQLRLFLFIGILGDSPPSRLLGTKLLRSCGMVCCGQLAPMFWPTFFLGSRVSGSVMPAPGFCEAHNANS